MYSYSIQSMYTSWNNGVSLNKQHFEQVLNAPSINDCKLQEA